MKTTPARVLRSLATIMLCLMPCLLLTGSVLSASPFTLVGGTAKTLTPAALTAAQKTQTKGQASSDGKTMTFTQKSVRLVAVTGPDNDMLSYRIDGLRNPTLIVPRRAVIKMLFVNTDDDMFHNIRFGVMPKAYPNVMTPYLKTSVGTPELPHKSDTALHGEEMVLHTPSAPGTYAYLCTVRGHAQGGMVGKVVIQ